MKVDLKKVRAILESEKPQMIADIEQMFGLGEHTWDEGPNFTPNKIHLIGMFDLINKYIFENKLDRTEPKDVILEGSDPNLPRNILAAFVSGCVDGMPHRILLVKHHGKDNFFNVFCTMIHEMIHLYDYEFGPMGKMIRENMVVGMLNWGPGYGSLEQVLKQAGIDQRQLPDNMPKAIAKQFQFPIYKSRQHAELVRRTGILDDPRTKPAKYELSDSSMYDVHGRFFKLYADRANYIGFDVTETFEAWRPHRLRKTWESDMSSANIAQALMSRLKSDSHMAYMYKDERNWFVEIS